VHSYTKPVEAPEGGFMIINEYTLNDFKKTYMHYADIDDSIALEMEAREWLLSNWGLTWKAAWK